MLYVPKAKRHFICGGWDWIRPLVEAALYSQNMESFEEPSQQAPLWKPLCRGNEAYSLPLPCLTRQMFSRCTDETAEAQRGQAAGLRVHSSGQRSPNLNYIAYAEVILRST